MGLQLMILSVGLCCLMTPGLSKDIQCHVWPYMLANQMIRHQSHQTINQAGYQTGNCTWRNSEMLRREWWPRYYVLCLAQHETRSHVNTNFLLVFIQTEKVAYFWISISQQWHTEWTTTLLISIKYIFNFNLIILYHVNELVATISSVYGRWKC